MRKITPKTTFEQFLNDFAEAVELAAQGEVEEARSILETSQHAAEEAAGQDTDTRGALRYRYDIAQRIFAERYNGD